MRTGISGASSRKMGLGASGKQTEARIIQNSEDATFLTVDGFWRYALNVTLGVTTTQMKRKN